MTGFSFQMVYDLVDIFWIGRISAKAVAGVTIFKILFWIIEALNEVIGVSSISLVSSQSFDKKDILRTDLAIEQTITFKFIVALIASLFLSIFLKPVTSFFVEKDIVAYGLDYGYIRLFFLPIMLYSLSLNSILQSVGDARIPMYIMLTATLINLILDPILIFEKIPFIGLIAIHFNGAGLGVFCAALATVISQTLTFSMEIYFSFFGSVAIAAFGIAGRIFGLVFLGFGLGLAVSFSESDFNKPFIYSSLISR